MATPICDSQPVTNAPVVPAALLSPIIVKSRMTIRLLGVPSSRKALSSTLQPAMRSVAPLPSNTRSWRSVRWIADESLYVPPALNAIVEPSGTPRMNDASAADVSLPPVASIDAGTFTVAPVVGGAGVTGATSTTRRAGRADSRRTAIKETPAIPRRTKTRTGRRRRAIAAGGA